MKLLISVIFCLFIGFALYFMLNLILTTTVLHEPQGLWLWALVSLACFVLKEIIS